jgi:hypothetical protein
MFESISIRPEIIFIAVSAVVIILSLVVFMVAKQKLFHTKSLWQNAELSFMFLLICSVGQYFLVRIVFFRDGNYHNHGIAGLFYFIAICLVPIVIAVVPSITISAIVMQKQGKQ